MTVADKQDQKKAQIESIYAHATGTEAYHKLGLSPVVATDGVLAVCQHAGAFWLFDAITSYSRKEEFQIWELESKDRKAVLTMKEDSDQPILVRQDIGHTDFPEGLWKFYLIDGVLLLPSEY